ncbi:MAG: 3-dehydroquinate synthase [Verrucomicrobia bacterium]|nr:3-dehydroquinate synthase [Verrucomicrobiota bacterium]
MINPPIPPRSVQVLLGNRRYWVEIGPDLLGTAGLKLHRLGLHGTVAVITDDNVRDLYGQTVLDSLGAAGFRARIYSVQAGEQSKSLAEVERLAESMARDAMDRSSIVVALGGGVIGDLAGFLAAIYYRGVALVQLPTSIMAQVDSAVGGKTAVNLQAGKNLVGAFYQPRLVMADTLTLRSLGRREWNEGFAEIIKYGVIRSPSLFSTLEADADLDVDGVVEACVQIKADIVAEDELETSGRRALLNFGHTLGHAIEAAAGYGALYHGEAISLGMCAAACISRKRAGLSAAEVTRLEVLLEKFSLPTQLPPELSPDQIVERTFTDKKFVRGQIRFVLASRIGHAFVSDEVTRDDLVEAIAYLQSS